MAIINAKEEFLEVTKGTKIVCAFIYLYATIYEYRDNDGEEILPLILKKGYSEEDFNIFLEKIDTTYDSGYGSQNLNGVIYCEDGGWFTRNEYDGSEWWEYNKYPNIPEMCL
jgi:hypothetical protein